MPPKDTFSRRADVLLMWNVPEQPEHAGIPWATEPLEVQSGR